MLAHRRLAGRLRRMGWWRMLAGLALASFVLDPFMWIVMISFTRNEELFVHGVRYVPANITLENYTAMFRLLRVGRAFANSLVVAIANVAWALPLAIPAAYAFARCRFPGRTVLIVSLLLVYMLPSIVLLIPLFTIFRTLGLLNTYPGLVLVQSTKSMPFCIWLLTNYFATLPRDLEDAARIDGCSRVGAMLRVALPLAVPGLVTAALVIFIGSWNNFLFAFMFTSGDKVRTLPVLLRLFKGGESGVEWGTTMAGAVVASIPVATVFLFFQKYLVRGLSAGGIKG